MMSRRRRSKSQICSQTQSKEDIEKNKLIDSIMEEIKEEEKRERGYSNDRT